MKILGWRRWFPGALLVLWVLLPCAPWGSRLPYTDSGYFLYTGWRILHGETSYRDVWECKPPVIHYLNALGLLLGGGSEWGVWALQLLCLAAAFALCHAVHRRSFGPRTAAFGTFAVGLNLTLVLQGGNLTEEYGLLLQFLMLFLGERAGTGGMGVVQGLGMGVVAGTLFLTKQNLVGMPIAVVWCLSRHGRRSPGVRPRFMAAVGLGAATLLAAVALYFHHRGALRQFWDAAFTYNFVYRDGSPGALFHSILAGFRRFAWSGLSVLGLAGWCYAALSKKDVPEHDSLVVRVCMVSLPLEMLLSGVSGRAFPHYYIPWLPSLGVLAALGQKRLFSARAALMGAGLVMAVVPMGFWWMEMRAVWARRAEDPMIRRMRDSLPKDERVLFWGLEARYNFAVRRAAPTRFAYQYPLYLKGYHSEGMVEEFLGNLREHEPSLIVDTSSQRPEVPPIGAWERSLWRPPTGRFLGLHPSMEHVFAYIQANYRPVNMSGLGRIYQRVRVKDR